MNLSEILLFVPLGLAAVLAATAGFHGPGGRHRRSR